MTQNRDVFIIQRAVGGKVRHQSISVFTKPVDFGFDVARPRLSCSVVAIAAPTGNGRRSASVLASRRIVDCGFHALAGSAMR